ncbi:chromosomal replication initiator protein DnaA [bacterium]|nr:chromosomal replication initiator protein DnaA [bacterium]
MDKDASTENLWDRIKEKIRSEVNDQSFMTWFAPTVQESYRDDTLTVKVPNKFFKDWLSENYRDVVQDAAKGIAGRECTVNFHIHEGRRQKAAADGRQLPLPEVRSLQHGLPSLNLNYTFESFVVGSSNQFAHAACLAVAQSKSRTYNPLFIYGGVGLGKTHLLHAIGHRFLDKNPGAKLSYLSSETFMNELINSIRYDRMHSFRNRYRNMDLLMIDDIQFIAGKEKTQEEFFHTFNSIYESHKQIIISSDKVPKDIPDLEERLRSRFEWGLIADIQTPDLETKVAILRKKADQNNIHLPDDVALFVAKSIKSNIRELEGSLIRLGAYASLSDQEITVDFTREILKDTLASLDRAVTVDAIKKEVASFFGLKISELNSKRRTQNIVFPRQVAMYLCRRLTDCSLPVIGKSFGGRDHSTVIHSVNLVERKLENNVEIKNSIDVIAKRLNG